MLALIWTVMAPLASQGEDMPAALHGNMLKEQAVAALKSGDIAALYQVMDEYRVIEKAGATVPPGLYLIEAETARSRNELLRTERAFGDYFRVASPEGEAYSNALSVYAEFKRSVAEAVWPMLDGMVLVPDGKLRLDDPSATVAATPAAARELPIKAFAIAKHEVTRGQFLEFVTATNYRMQPGESFGDGSCDLENVDWENPGFDQTNEHPVVCVSWADAQAYIDWLNQSSGLRFRLPSAAEWEYAARGRTATAYWYGDDYDADRSNGQGAVGKDRWDSGTAPVGQFPANPFGLQDMLGNVSEWTRDCVGGADQTPARDGAAEGPADCRSRVARGGNWTSDAARSRASHGLQLPTGSRTNDLGFRLAMDL